MLGKLPNACEQTDPMTVYHIILYYYTVLYTLVILPHILLYRIIHRSYTILYYVIPYYTLYITQPP